MITWTQQLKKAPWSCEIIFQFQELMIHDQAGGLTRKLEPPATYFAPIHHSGNLSKDFVLGVFCRMRQLHNSHGGVVVDVEEWELLLPLSQDDEQTIWENPKLRSIALSQLGAVWMYCSQSWWENPLEMRENRRIIWTDRPIWVAHHQYLAAQRTLRHNTSNTNTNTN